MSSRVAALARLAALAALAGAVGGCAALDRLTSIGQEPKLTAIENPVSQPGYKPVQMPMPDPIPASYSPNSLWRNGSRAFFKDQRAQQVGDILTIKVKIADKAEIENATKRKRSGAEDATVDHLLGHGKMPIFRNTIPTTLVALEANGSTTGEGSVNRSEDVSTNVAAVVTQVLPNGNLVIEGRQEVRVNFEMRELIVAGIVRPEDIQADNTIGSEKIAQARIAYGGRGQITDVQQPRYGQQVLDIILPF